MGDGGWAWAWAWAWFQIDLLEHPNVTNIVLLTTVLDEVKHRSAALYTRAREMVKNPDKHVHVFANEVRSHRSAATAATAATAAATAAATVPPHRCVRRPPLRHHFLP